MRRRNAQAYLHLLQRFLVAGNDLGHDVWRLFVDGATASLELFETVADQLNELRVIETAGGGDDEIFRRKTLTVELKDGFLFEPAHRLIGAKNGFAQRVILEKILREDLVDEIIRIVFIRSEERRVGKECKVWWSRYTQETKK